MQQSAATQSRACASATGRRGHRALRIRDRRHDPPAVRDAVLIAAAACRLAPDLTARSAAELGSSCAEDHLMPSSNPAVWSTAASGSASADRRAGSAGSPLAAAFKTHGGWWSGGAGSGEAPVDVCAIASIGKHVAVGQVHGQMSAAEESGGRACVDAPPEYGGLLSLAAPDRASTRTAEQQACENRAEAQRAAAKPRLHPRCQHNI